MPSTAAELGGISEARDEEETWKAFETRRRLFIKGPGLRMVLDL